MNNLLEYSKYDPRNEYKAEDRRDLDIDKVRKSKEYRNVIDLGFKEVHSYQQDLNNTLKFIRTKQKQKEDGHGDVFYTIHPSGTVRRYNPKYLKVVEMISEDFLNHLEVLKNIQRLLGIFLTI